MASTRTSTATYRLPQRRHPRVQHQHALRSVHTRGPIKGKAELRSAFEQFIAEFGQAGTAFELTREDDDGEHGYINWTAETGANVYEYGVDAFTVRDGKIVVQFFGAKTTPK